VQVRDDDPPGARRDCRCDERGVEAKTVVGRAFEARDRGTEEGCGGDAID